MKKLLKILMGISVVVVLGHMIGAGWSPTRFRKKSTVIEVKPFDEERYELNQRFLKAASDGDFVMLQQFIKNRLVDINTHTTFGDTALHYAAYQGDQAMVEYLMAQHADPTLKDYYGITPIGYARNKGYDTIVWLMENGHDEGLAKMWNGDNGND